MVRMLKAIARERGWNHSRHRHHKVNVSRVRSTTGDGDIRRLFDFASGLHENFCGNFISSDEVAGSLDNVPALLDKLHHQLRQP